jgi:hypothetical protein
VDRHIQPARIEATFDFGDLSAGPSTSFVWSRPLMNSRPRAAAKSD